jgi:hypothetical protein
MPYTIRGQSQKQIILNRLNEDYQDNERKSKYYYKKILDKDLKLKMYIYREKYLKNNNGLCIANLRLIIIDESIRDYQYCVTLTHEMMHLKRYRKQENYICFETFKYLYESEELHDVGVWYAIRQINGCYSSEYNISNQVLDYLTNK